MINEEKKLQQKHIVRLDIVTIDPLKIKMSSEAVRLRMEDSHVR